MLDKLRKYLRNIKRSKLSFTINLIGLTCALTCVLFIYLWVKDELQYDKFHKNETRLVQMMTSTMVNGEFQTDTQAAAPMVKVLGEVLPEIQEAVSVTESYAKNTLSFDQKDISTKGIYSENAFFKLFSFDLLAGNPESLLTDKYNIVVTEKLALKLFGATESAMGKTITFDGDTQFKVTGIVKSIPSNSSIQFDFVIPLSLYNEHTGLELNWGEKVVSGYFMLQPDVSIEQLNRNISDLLESEGIDISKTVIFTRSFSDGYLYSNYENGIQKGGRIAYVKLFIIIGIVILLIACINFISLSTALAIQRKKEVGMKKVLGANRKSIIQQYLGESTLLALISFIVSLMLLVLFLPSFNEIANKKIIVDFSYGLVVPFLLIVVITGILAGIYPAIYISGFKPTEILSSKSHGVGTEWVRRGLVVTQFTTSIILVVFTIVVHSQFSMIQNRNLGYDKENVMYFEMDGDVIKKRETFLSEIRSIPGVARASSVFVYKDSPLGSEMVTNDISWPTKSADETLLIDYRVVDYDFIEVMGVKIKKGRSFSEELGSEGVFEVVINEAAVEAMGLKNPIGQKINVWGADRVIVGIAKDFTKSIYEGKVKPMVYMHLVNHGFGAFNTIMVKLDNNIDVSETLGKIEVFHSKFNPGFPFEYRFLDQDFQQLYASERKLSILSRYFAVLAIIISCLGLFGLTTFTVSKRKKEISIRKVMGSSGYQIIVLLFKDVSKLVFMAMLIGVPICYLFTRNWLENFAVRINLEPWFFIVTGLLFFVLMILASSFQVIRTLSIRPSEALRNES